MDKDDTDPDETTETHLDAGDSPMDDSGDACAQSKKRKKSAVVPPDDFVTDRIKELKKPICGVKGRDVQRTTNGRLC